MHLPENVQKFVDLKKNTGGVFHLFAIVDITKETIIHEADMTFQDGKLVYQFVFVPSDDADKPKFEIKPGSFVIQETNMGTVLQKSELRIQNILTSVVNTSFMVNEMNTFFQKIDIYKRRLRPAVRKLLLHSAPGLGKSSGIYSYCIEEMKKDPGMVVITWPTSSVRPSSVLEFMDNGVVYNEAVTRVILIMEDIGGVSKEGDHGPRYSEASILEFLDGGRNIFKMPTFVIATTNYPENLNAVLGDRPGRFDKVKELKAPIKSEQIAITEFSLERKLTDEEIQLFDIKGVSDFGPAHLIEMVDRHLLYDISLEEAAKELLDQRKKFKNNFEDKNDLGLRWM